MDPDPAHDTLLVETIARHFPDAEITDEDIALGFGQVRISCRVHSVRPLGPYRVASLFFSLRGGLVAAPDVFASVSGYGTTTEEAIAVGACNWACAFGPVLRAGLAAEAQPEVARFEATLDAQPVRVFVDALDRALSLDAEDPTPRVAAARARFAPGSWLTRTVVESGLLPLLAPDRPTVLSVFVSDAPNGRVVEVKVDGVDWLGMDAAFAAIPLEGPGAIAMLRELAIVVPTGATPPLARAPVARTLAGIAARPQARWRGFGTHGGALAEPVPRAALGALGELPADYLAFVTTVAASGAGPGYGLLSPLGDRQAALAAGTFTWTHEAAPIGDPAGVLALAHAGCGVMYLLVVAGAARGEVWVDARGSDGLARRVAPSFAAWYRDWLGAAARDVVPWIQWDGRCCATANTLSKVLDSIEADGITGDAAAAELPRRITKPGALTLASGGSAYFAAGAMLDPCRACVQLAARFELAESVFAAGQPPDVGRPAPAKRGWWAKLTGRD